jgi:hypothetical protein
MAGYLTSGVNGEELAQLPERTGKNDRGSLY